MPTPDPVRGDAAFPARVDVAVVGGGIVGAMTALELVERGHSVALLEKGVIAGEQSGRNWGWVRMARRDPREIDLMDAAITLWEGLSARVGADVGYRQCGVLAPFHDAAARRANEAWLASVGGAAPGVAVIGAAEARALLPDAAYPFDGALWSARDGRAEPQAAAPAVARAAQARGAHVLTGCAVRLIETRGGAISGVLTERGRIACDAVVVAGGVWSRLLLRDLGLSLPQLKILNSVARTTPVPDGPETSLRGPDFSARRRADGGYTIATLGANVFDLTPDALRFLRPFWPLARREGLGMTPRLTRRFLTEWTDMARRGPDDVSPYERTRVLDPAPVARHCDRALAALKAVLPAFAGASIVERWAGWIDVSPDAVPVISTVAGRPGLVVATGLSGHGFGLGPAVGRLAADLATGAAPFVDARAFRFARFTDGAPIVPLTGV